MLSEKRLEKLHKTLGTIVGELDGLSPEELKKRIVGSEQGIKELVDEMEAKPEFEAAKNVLKELRSDISQPVKEMKAVTAYCLHLLEEKGQ